MLYLDSGSITILVLVSFYFVYYDPDPDPLQDSSQKIAAYIVHKVVPDTGLMAHFLNSNNTTACTRYGF